MILPSMLVGEEIPNSLDFSARLPEGVTLVSATHAMRSGSTVGTVDRVAVSGSKVQFWVTALTTGTVAFNMLATLSDGSIDGEQVMVSVA